MIILGIETSCDETSVALLEGTPRRLKLKKHIIASQAAIHKKYGGVVPEVAARKHSEVLPILLDKELGRKAVSSADCIAVTTGPGLVTSLMIGVQTAKTLSYALSKPLVGVNHMEAHLYSNWLTHPELVISLKKYLPALVLIVSGGHTMFVLMTGHGRYKLLGQTLDDAAGESFDKVAKMLGLGYPGGPVISKLARKGNPAAIKFPRPMAAAPGYDVSFSGLKTAVLYYLEKKRSIASAEIPDIVASFQQAVVDALMSKIRRAYAEFHPRSLMLAGGVAANSSLREAMHVLGNENNVPTFVPDLEFTGDNAAMIAVAGYYRRHSASLTAWKHLQFNARLKFAQHIS